MIILVQIVLVVLVIALNGGTSFHAMIAHHLGESLATVGDERTCEYTVRRPLKTSKGERGARPFRHHSQWVEPWNKKSLIWGAYPCLTHKGLRALETEGEIVLLYNSISQKVDINPFHASNHSSQSLRVIT